MPDETCMAFDSVPLSDPNVVHRFVVGADTSRRGMAQGRDQAAGRPVRIVAPGSGPRSGAQLVKQIRAAVPKGNPLKQRRSFVLGEGSQLASTADSAGVDRTMRLSSHSAAAPTGPTCS